MPNLKNPSYDEDRDPEGFRARRARLAKQAGSKRLGVSIWEVAAGQAAYPYHWHVVEEELIVVLEGRPSLRGHNGGWRELAPGEVVAFRVGPEGGHQLWNRTGETVRFLSASSWWSGPEICIYADSDKVGVYSEYTDELYIRSSAVDYWVGETPPSA
jgi:uncharacterized cupin superfamily protein